MRGQDWQSSAGGIAQLAVERVPRVWSVLDWNEPSIRFYESLGAVAMNA
jgi:hypothetical protein